MGVGFVVLAFAFLLKLSFDRGWITPALRLGVGFAAGTGLIVLGLRLESGRKWLAQAMLGGGIALLYLVGFAGSQLYGLLPTWAALSLMSTTTLLAIVLADRQDSSILSIIGLCGGLATPFLLGVVAANPGGVAIYTALVLLGAAPVHFHKGWPELLVSLVSGGALALGGVVAGSSSSVPLLPFAALVAVFWMATVPSPIFRPMFRTSNAPADELWLTRAVAALGTAATASAVAWQIGMTRTESGVMLLGLGLLTGSLALFSRGAPRAQAPAAEIAALTVGIGLAAVAWSSLGVFLVMAEVSALLMLASMGAPPTLANVAHWLGLAVAIAFVGYSQVAEPGGFLGLREGALLRVGVLALAVVAALWTRELAGVYKGAAYVGLLVWLLSELAHRPNGQAMLSIAWGLQGTLALLAAIRRPGARVLQGAGLATLGLVAGKLLLVDLAQLDPIWRILLFLGFGTTLLGLGYLVNVPKDQKGHGAAV